eukprot:6186685-Pleurochrysis_carterae.AAC.1
MPFPLPFPLPLPLPLALGASGLLAADLMLARGSLVIGGGEAETVRSAGAARGSDILGMGGGVGAAARGPSGDMGSSGGAGDVGAAGGCAARESLNGDDDGGGGAPACALGERGGGVSLLADRSRESRRMRLV